MGPTWKTQICRQQLQTIFIRQKKIGPSRACSRKGMRDIFQQKEKKGQKMIKKCKIFENLGKHVQNLKML